MCVCARPHRHTVLVHLGDHAADLLVARREAQLPHHCAELLRRDVPVAVPVEQVERLLQVYAYTRTLHLHLHLHLHLQQPLDLYL